MSFTNGWDGPKPYATQLGWTPDRAELTLPSPDVGTIPLRPLTVGDILGSTFKAARFAPLTTFGLTLFVSLIAALLGGVAGLFLEKELGLSLNPFGSEEGLDDISLFSTSTLIALAASQVTTAVAAIGIMWVVTESTRARRVTLRQTLRHMGRRLWPALGVWALFGLAAAVAVSPVVALMMVATSSSGDGADGAIALGVLLLLAEGVVAVWIGVKLMLAPCVVAVEPVGPLAAIRRSWTLTSGRFWPILGTYLLASMIISLASGTVTQVFSFALTLVALSQPGIGLTVATLASSVVSQVLTLPLSTAVITLLYVDARIRREGYDLTLSEEMYG
ncbi:MAG: glycerophosphoryl diester phosphodiesterase membrane domain-containing protein [Actinobacteria bacterium]|nr:glycerophosphoryl diester phosphodiesterase membrane domain-containing protein [Actinomycetota bacterium]